MTGLVCIVTAAGRAALVNAAHDGTNAVRIAQLGVTATPFAAAAANTVLPGELARLATISGASVDADTIHLTVRDDGITAYSLRGFAMYLADGTLFALYGQADVIVEKTTQSTMLLALDVRFADINAATLTFADSSFLNPPATTDTLGVVALATLPQTIAGTDNTRAVTPYDFKGALDDRLGDPAAPSTFIKTLLTAATVVAFRLALGLKSAALKDDGPGGGLDADTLHGLAVGPAIGNIGPDTYPFIPRVDTGGIMEVGNGFDIHTRPADGVDYFGRLAIDGTGKMCWNYAVLWNAANDGSGSGLDADLLDGQDSSYFTAIAARLGYTPYNATNPAGYLAAITGPMVVAALGYTPWHASNDGSGSGLDADLLDGQDSSWFTNIPGRLGYTPYNATNPAAYISGINSGMVTTALTYTPWGPNNDGSGSGLDADLLDGRDSSSFANASHTHSAADLAPAFTAAQLLGPNGYQYIPGGLLLQWGQDRNFHSGEVTITTAFPIAFSAAPWSITVTALNTSGNTGKNIFEQNESRTASTFTVFDQDPGGGGASIDGFDWFAIGPA